MRIQNPRHQRSTLSVAEAEADFVFGVDVHDGRSRCAGSQRDPGSALSHRLAQFGDGRCQTDSVPPPSGFVTVSQYSEDRTVESACQSKSWCYILSAITGFCRHLVTQDADPEKSDFEDVSAHPSAASTRLCPRWDCQRTSEPSRCRWCSRSAGTWSLCAVGRCADGAPIAGRSHSACTVGGHLSAVRTAVPRTHDTSSI